MNQSLSRAITILTAAQQTFREPTIAIPRLTAFVDALLGFIQQVQDATLKSSSVQVSLFSQINNLANSIDDTKVQVQEGIRSLSAYASLQCDVHHELQQSSDLSTQFDKLLVQTETLKDQADKIERTNCFTWLSSKHRKTLRILERGIADVIKDFENHCKPIITQILQSAHTIVQEQRPSPTQSFVKPPHTISASGRDIAAPVSPPFAVPVPPTPTTPDDQVLDKLPRVDADFRAAVNINRSGFLQGTRVDLLAQLEAWAEGESDFRNRRVCVLSGGAGTGKSTVASEFARRLDERNHLGASFFFLREREDHNSTKLFFSVVAFQLAGHDRLSGHKTSFRSHFVDAARKHLKNGTRQQMKYQAEDLLMQPLESATHQPHPEPIVIVVDAVDECTQDHPEDLKKMLRFLVSCTQKTVPLKIFLTSRPERHIEDMLSSSELSEHIHTISIHDIPRESVDRDIKLYLSTRLAGIPSGVSLLQQHPDVLDRLTERAEGLFVYAQTAMNFLEHDPDHLMEQTAILLYDDPSAHLHGALEPLDKLYLTVLETAFPPAYIRAGTAAYERLQSTLACIALLRDHLTPRVLHTLMMNIPVDDSLSVLNKLHSVILCGRGERAIDETFQPLHSTFSEFLVDSDRCRNPTYFIEEKTHHARLAEGCLRTLNASLRKNVLQLGMPSTFCTEDEVNLRILASTYILPHVRYACVHWSAHLVKAEWTDELGRLLTSFAGQKILMWLETLGYMDKLDVAKQALEDASRRSSQSELCPASVPVLFEKSIQLVSQHHDSIERCPNNVYAYGAEGGIVDVVSTFTDALESPESDTPAVMPMSPGSEPLIHNRNLLSTGSGSNPSQLTKSIHSTNARLVSQETPSGLDGADGILRSKVNGINSGAASRQRQRGVLLQRLQVLTLSSGGGEAPQGLPQQPGESGEAK